MIAAASEPDSIVTNGMSRYARDDRNANSALLVGISPEDFRTAIRLPACTGSGLLSGKPSNLAAAPDMPRHSWQAIFSAAFPAGRSGALFPVISPVSLIRIWTFFSHLCSPTLSGPPFHCLRGNFTALTTRMQF